MILLAILLIVILLKITYAPYAITVFGVSKTHAVIAAVVIAFVLGYMAGRPGRRQKFGHVHYDDTDNTHPNTLSDEDRDYIS